MRIPRIFYPFKKEEKNSININLAASHHLKVINIKEEQEVELFNGNLYFFNALIPVKSTVHSNRAGDISSRK